MRLKTINADFVNKHFLKPRNVGDIDNPEAVGKAGSLTCGATVRVSLRISEQQRITATKFKASGCSYLVAFSSFLTDELRGKTSGEAAAFAQCPRTAILERFGPAPAGKEHCAALVCEALVSAIRQYSDSVRDEWSGDEALICTCFGVSELTIEREIKAGGLRTVTEVTETCNAGAGCRSCCSLIQDIIDDCSREGRIP